MLGTENDHAAAPVAASWAQAERSGGPEPVGEPGGRPKGPGAGPSGGPREGPNAAEPSRPPDADPAALAAALRVVLGRLWRRLRAEHSFPLTQGAVLARLEREGPQSTAELAAAERVRPQSMGQTVAELEVQGLISRHPDPSDGRRVLLQLTDDGRVALARDRERREGWLAGAIHHSTDEAQRRALAQAIEVLERLGEL